jgi:hypothetical protein
VKFGLSGARTKCPFYAVMIMWFIEFKEQEITSNNYYNNIFIINSIKALDWCMNCDIWKKILEEFSLKQKDRRTTFVQPKNQ